MLVFRIAFLLNGRWKKGIASRQIPPQNMRRAAARERLNNPENGDSPQRTRRTQRKNKTLACVPNHPSGEGACYANHPNFFASSAVL